MPDRIVVPVQPGYKITFESRHGVVGKDLDRRARLVERAAVAQAGFQTGTLKRSINRRWISAQGRRLTVRVGSDVGYAFYHHEGTHPHEIDNVRREVVRFVADDGKVVFAEGPIHHPGTRANKFLTDNLPLAVR